MTPYPILYSFRRCPYAIRARLAIAISGQTCTLREVVLRAKPAELLQASPKATVPVLVLPSGEVLDQSLDIMYWALRQHDPQHWLPSTPLAQEMTPQWLAQCDGPFKQWLDRYKYPQRFGHVDGHAFRAQAADFLAGWNRQLQRTGHLAGEQTGLADMAIAPFVRQFAHVDAQWFAQQDWNALHTWLGAFEASALFTQVMAKYAPWQPNHPPEHFPVQTHGGHGGPVPRACCHPY